MAKDKKVNIAVTYPTMLVCSVFLFTMISVFGP
jgi:hypothetical protein